MLDELELNTVCQGAKCPNRGECFSSGTATFMVMGDTCTRSCRFCAVDARTPGPPDPGEPARLAEAVERMGLEHVVITMVTRDDLPDGGAEHLVAVIRAVRECQPHVAIEVLTSDFAGDLRAVDMVVDAGPDVYNHNVETVPRLYPEVRPEADYRRSLAVLARARQRPTREVREAEVASPAGSGRPAAGPTKSGLMLGLGETVEEVVDVMSDLRDVGCSMLTLGQYLRPSQDHLPVAEFVAPESFAELARTGYALGFESVASAPFVRSSYHAHEMAEERANTVGSER
jgi:lipoic acid synthetase